MNISIILMYEAIDLSKSDALGKQARLYDGPKEEAEEAARKDLLQIMNQQCVTWYHIMDTSEATVINV